MKLDSLARGPFPFSEAIHLAWELAMHGMRRAALAVAAVGAGVAGGGRAYGAGSDVVEVDDAELTVSV